MFRIRSNTLEFNTIRKERQERKIKRKQLKTDIRKKVRQKWVCSTLTQRKKRLLCTVQKQPLEILHSIPLTRVFNSGSMVAFGSPFFKWNMNLLTSLTFRVNAFKFYLFGYCVVWHAKP